MNATPSIDELAKAAIEAKAKFDKSKHPNEEGPFEDWQTAHQAFAAAATPEAWLTLSARVRELESALKPFAEKGEIYSDKRYDLLAGTFQKHLFRVSDLRRAATLSPPLQMKQPVEPKT